jgi:hypothetical protein
MFVLYIYHSNHNGLYSYFPLTCTWQPLKSEGFSSVFKCGDSAAEDSEVIDCTLCPSRHRVLLVSGREDERWDGGLGSG